MNKMFLTKTIYLLCDSSKKQFYPRFTQPLFWQDAMIVSHLQVNLTKKTSRLMNKIDGVISSNKFFHLIW